MHFQDGPGIACVRIAECNVPLRREPTLYSDSYLLYSDPPCRFGEGPSPNRGVG